jgi:hypothetical protein
MGAHGPENHPEKEVVVTIPTGWPDDPVHATGTVDQRTADATVTTVTSTFWPVANYDRRKLSRLPERLRQAVHR